MALQKLGLVSLGFVDIQCRKMDFKEKISMKMLSKTIKFQTKQLIAKIHNTNIFKSLAIP